MIDEIYNNLQITIRPWKLFYPNNAKNIGVKFSDDQENKGFTSLKAENFRDSTGENTDSNISSKNLANIRVCFLQTFFFMFNISIIIPTNYLFIEKLGYDAIISGLIISLAPMGTFLANITTSILIKNNFRIQLLISISCLILGNLLYSISQNLGSIFPMILGRLILGMGCARQLNKQYIISYIPKRSSSSYFFQYLLYCSLGLATGNHV